ncbi:Hypothetical protein D9617_6g095030 [Elsinoe fawcettii]|nr:Hypothetical protein D9617_6g095030 [Elsinoe fawcettii]
MARVAKSKKNRDVSIHSRAARRAASPSIDVDKSILDAKPERESNDGHASIYGGVLKRQKKKPLSRQQRLRQEKGLEKAAQNLDKLSKKVADSHFREKKVKTRNTAWDDLNDKIATKPTKQSLQKDTASDIDEEDSELVEELGTDITPVLAASVPAGDQQDDIEVDEVL